MLNRLRSELENELKTQTLRDEFKRLKEKHPPIESLRTPQELIEFLDTGGDYNQKDEVLAILIKEYGGESPLRVAGTVLILSFLPVIKNIYFSQCHNYDDCEELLCTIQCCFLEAAQNYPLDKRPRKIAVNLKFLTIRSFLDMQSALYEANDVQKLLLNEAEKYSPDAEQLSEAYPGIAPAAVNDDESVEVTIRNYRVFMDAGIINEDDFKLVVDTRIYGRDTREVANEIGISIEAAWKRRKRAEQAMKDHFKKYF